MTNEELAAAVRSGEMDKLLELWEQVRRFAHDRAYKWTRALEGRGGVTVDDLEQAAFLALLDALDGWKPEEGGAFLTWYGLRLKSAFTAAAGLRTQRDRRDPLESAKSLDEPLDGEDDGDPFTLGDVVPDYSAEAAFADIAEWDRWERLHNAVEAALQSLEEPQETVIRSRYYRGRTLREAAEEMGITVTQAQKHEAAALRSLRHPRISRMLKVYL